MSVEARPHPAYVRQSGRLDLALELIDGTTRPVRAHAAPPLQLGRVRYDDPDDPGRACYTLVHLGGVLQGDDYHLRVDLQPGAAASVTTAAATQVYCMPEGDARQELALNLHPGSRLAWLPEPTILFAGARFAQTTRIHLAPDALLSFLDVFVPGRLARGEAHQFERYENRFEVYDSGGRCLVAERALLDPRRQQLTLPGLFGATPVVGSLYLLGSAVDAERVYAAVVALGAPLLGAALLPNVSGLLVRALGTSPHVVHSTLKGIWHTFTANAWHNTPG